MGRRRFGWLVMAVLLGVLGLVWRQQSFEAVSWVAGVLALFVALAPEFRRFIRGGEEGDPVTWLAAVVREQWQAEESTRGLAYPWPLPVRWENSTLPVADHWEVIRAKPGERDPLDLSGELDQVADMFRRIPSRRLVVLGPAGAGKSVLLLRLTLDLLEKRAPDDPVPVLLPLSSWNPDDNDLHEWLAAALGREYPALRRLLPSGRTLAAELVATGRVLPILDGLDEMPARLRVRALERIKEVPRSSTLVLASRPDEYQAAVATKHVLAAGAVVSLCPLTLDKVEHYLGAATPAPLPQRWPAFVAELRTRPRDPLHEVLALPLMVFLVRIGYAKTGLDPVPLLDRTRLASVEAIEAHLLDCLIPTLYRRGVKPQRPCNVRTAKRRFTFLANHIADPAGDLAWYHLYRSLPLARWLPAVSLVIGVLSGLLSAAAIILNSGARPALTGLTVAVAVAVASAGSLSLRRAIPTGRRAWGVRIHIRGVWSRRIMLGVKLLLGFVAGMMVMVALTTSVINALYDRDGATPALVLTANVLLLAGGVAGAGFVWRRRRLSVSVGSPGRSVRFDGSLVLTIWLVVRELPAVLAVVLTIWLSRDDDPVLLIGLGVGTGLLSALARSAHSPDQPVRVSLRPRRGFWRPVGVRAVLTMKFGVFVAGYAELAEGSFSGSWGTDVLIGGFNGGAVGVCWPTRRAPKDPTLWFGWTAGRWSSTSRCSR